MRKINGFNLFELMITLFIIGILSALCLPVYSNHLVHARRLEAEINLFKLANALEQYHIVNNTYQNAELATLGLSEKVAHGQYRLLIRIVSETDYAIEALPLDKQAESDGLCGSLLLNSEGKRGVTGSGELGECWG